MAWNDLQRMEIIGRSTTLLLVFGFDLHMPLRVASSLTENSQEVQDILQRGFQDLLRLVPANSLLLTYYTVPINRNADVALTVDIRQHSISHCPFSLNHQC